MIRLGSQIRLTRREVERFRKITDIEPVDIRTLDDLDAYFHFGLILWLSGPGGQYDRCKVRCKLFNGSGEIRFISVSFDDQCFRIIWHDKGWHAAHKT